MVKGRRKRERKDGMAAELKAMGMLRLRLKRRKIGRVTRLRRLGVGSFSVMIWENSWTTEKIRRRGYTYSPQKLK